MFQFQTGAIKSELELFNHTSNQVILGFNSKLVRLKVGTQIVANRTLQQAFAVSIPNWFD